MIVVVVVVVFVPQPIETWRVVRFRQSIDMHERTALSVPYRYRDHAIPVSYNRHLAQIAGSRSNTSTSPHEEHIQQMRKMSACARKRSIFIANLKSLADHAECRPKRSNHFMKASRRVYIHRVVGVHLLLNNRDQKRKTQRSTTSSSEARRD